jgi:hypothetical protein
LLCGLATNRGPTIVVQVVGAKSPWRSASVTNNGRELGCCVCGYSLKGVGNAAACRECGAPTERSRLWAERAAGVIPSPAATRRWLAVQAVLDAGLVFVVVGTPFVHRAIPMDSPAESRTLSILYFGWFGLWTASIVSGAIVARTLTRGTARPIASAAFLACGVGSIVLAGATGLALFSGQGFHWAATDTARGVTQLAEIAWSLGAIFLCMLSTRVMDAISGSKRTWFRTLCYALAAAHAAWMASRLAWWLGAGDIPFFILSGLNWTLGVALSSARGWLLFAAIRQRTVRASRPPSIASPSAG